jgi:hypothetical protein
MVRRQEERKQRIRKGTGESFYGEMSGVEGRRVPGRWGVAGAGLARRSFLLVVLSPLLFLFHLLVNPSLLPFPSLTPPLLSCFPIFSSNLFPFFYYLSLVLIPVLILSLF